MKQKSFGEGPLEPGAIDEIKGHFFSRKQLESLAADIFHYLRRLDLGKATGPDLLEGQVHQEAQVSQSAILFPDSLAPGSLILVGHHPSPANLVSGTKRQLF
jgi:hypothetical protein